MKYYAKNPMAMPIKESDKFVANMEINSDIISNAIITAFQVFKKKNNSSVK
jgi:hypothetical protein